MQSPCLLTSYSTRDSLSGELFPARWIGLRLFPGRVFFIETIVLIDGQNLYHSARTAWLQAIYGASSPCAWPSYDVEKLAYTLTSRVPGRILSEIRSYTGVPNPSAGPSQRFWHGFWTNKLRRMRNQSIYVFRGGVRSGGQEKGIDVSLALDLVQATYEQRFDVAIIVSQDSDFGPAVRLSKAIAQTQNRNLTFESCFPYGPGSTLQRGVPGTVWFQIYQATYDACLDLTDYRPKGP